ncbi:hypothetical protein SH661x_001055 [Planctomicrobium sp. SH661]|uniref:hypothetical protein n=1 Tax=Planctomicrobium sp. SH661 TaxID=3448124 RepID=UPI003F5AE6CC
MISAITHVSETTVNRLPEIQERSNFETEIHSKADLLVRGMVLMLEEHDAMTEEERKLLADLLAERSMSLYLQPACHRFPEVYVAVPSRCLGVTAGISRTGPMTHSFTIDAEDRRFRSPGEVEFHVHNAIDWIHAKKILREFLEDLDRIGYCVR